MKNFIVTSAPHLKDKKDTSQIMRDVFISLIPALIASIYFFRLQAVKVISLSILSAVGSEYLWQKLTHREITINDWSAVVTGLLLAFVLPPSIPWWIAILGGIVAIILGKQIFGGLGYNIFNPALIARAVLLASWPQQMSTWISPINGVTTATPLNIVKEGLPLSLPTNLEMFIGQRAGCLGEISIIALILGAIYLLAKKIISLHIPLSYLLTVVVFCGILKQDIIFNLLAGGLILGAFFMATDYVTSPITKKGKIIFGIGCGIITMLIRWQGGFPEGVCYAILIMNMFTPLIDKYTKPRVFGSV